MIAELAGELPPAEAEAARMRAQAFDLERLVEALAREPDDE